MGTRFCMSSYIIYQRQITQVKINIELSDEPTAASHPLKPSQPRLIFATAE